MSAQPSRQAVIYTRISQDRTGAGLGVERQEKDCRALAAQLGWSVVAVRTDNDISAYSRRKRPGYLALLEDLDTRRAAGVLAWHTDRLHRSPLELERYIQVCEEREVITHTVTAGPIDLSTPAGRMHARIAGAVARHESEHRSARIRRKRQEVAEAGGWHPGARPFGYDADGVTLRPLEADLIRSSIEALLAGDSLRAVVRRVNASGLRTTFGRLDWDVISFRDVLLRPRNAGLRQHRGEIIGPAVWEPIVDEDQWRTLVALLKDPRRKTSPSNRVKYLGSGLYVCAGCGETSMYCSVSGAHRSPAYRCRGAGSDHVVRTAGPLDHFVTDVILARLSAPDARDLLTATRPAAEVNALRAERDALTTHSEQLTSELDSPLSKRTVARIVAAAERIDRRLDEIELEIAIATVPGPLDSLIGAHDPREVWELLDIVGRRRALDTLMTVTVLPGLKGRPKGWRVGDPYFDPDSVRIEWKTPAARP